MESKVDYTASPPPYPSVTATPYPPAPGTAPGSTSYPAAQAHQQYPPPSQYPPPAQTYPPATGPAPYGQPQGYGNPTEGHTPQPGRGGAPPYVAALPQQQVLYVSATQSPVMVQQVSFYVCHIVFACIVMWFCNWLFGLIAFILAAVASSTAVSDPGQARRLGHASIGLSIAGIVVTVVVIVIAVAVVAGSSCNYAMYGTCYRYRSSSFYGYCDGIRVHGYCYYN